MISYSFIIPHKNIPSLLKRCIASIPNLPDIEIIVIDDNSNEKTVEELKKISRDNLRIFFSKENKGAGYARNIGLNNAQGKWVLFADADDFFVPNIFEIINPYRDDPHNLILFNSICKQSENLSQDGDRKSLCDDFSKKQKAFLDGKTDAIHLLVKVCVPWSKMIRLDHLLANNIFFEEVKYANDVGWCTLLALKTKDKDIFVSNKTLYCLTDRASSLFHTRDDSAYLCRFGVLCRQQMLLNEVNIHTPFNFCDYVIQARLKGILFLLKFYTYILRSDFQIDTVYSIEKKIQFKKPFIYMFIQFVKSILNLPLDFIRCCNKVFKNFYCNKKHARSLHK